MRCFVVTNPLSVQLMYLPSTSSGSAQRTPRFSLRSIPRPSPQRQRPGWLMASFRGLCTLPLLLVATVLTVSAQSSGCPTPSFATAVPYNSGGTDPVTVTTADFNGDDIVDLAVVNRQSTNIGILLGTAAGTFAPVVTYSSGSSQPTGITTGDFNGDGKADLAVANAFTPEPNSARISILLGMGNGTFASAVTYSPGGNGPRGITTADFNGDGKADLAVANFGSNTVGILLGTGNGTFAPAVTYGSGGTGPLYYQHR